LDLSKVKTALALGNIEWERHVLERLLQRTIPRSAVIEVLGTADCIEDYPHDRPFPSALFLGRHRGKPLHVVAALNEVVPKIFIITTYEPDLEHFEPDFRTRRRR
jgi:hypothetical protein